MATCGEDFLLNCRFAGRGSGQVVFDSHGLNLQETDPKVVIWDENVGKEEHPDDRDRRKIQETNPQFFILDESHGKEEHPEDGGINYHSPPCFDDYGKEEMNMEDYLWVAKALNGVTIEEGKLLKGFDFLFGSVRCATNDTVCLHVNSVAQIFSKVMKGVAVTVGHAIVTTDADLVDSVGAVPIGGQILDGCDAPSLETPTIDPINMVDLNFSSINMNLEKLNIVGLKFCGPIEATPKFEDGVRLGVHLKDRKVYRPFNLNDNLPNEGKDIKIIGLPYKVDGQSEETRSDVPFDPGGLDVEAKLEDEFFSKTGRMMRMKSFRNGIQWEPN